MASHSLVSRSKSSEDYEPKPQENTAPKNIALTNRRDFGYITVHLIGAAKEKFSLDGDNKSTEKQYEKPKENCSSSSNDGRYDRIRTGGDPS